MHNLKRGYNNIIATAINCKNGIFLGYNFPATVPGGIYSDLMENKIIEDVFFKSNDINTRWVSKIDWNYTRTFKGK